MRVIGRQRVLVGAVATAVVLAGPWPLAADAGTGAVAGSAGIGDPYFPQDGNGGIDVQHYDIHDTYRFSPARISGTTTLRIRAKEALSSFHLDFLLPVPAGGVQVDGAPASFTRPTTHELVVRPAQPLASGQVFTTTVTYAGNPEVPSYAGESNWLASSDQVVAMNEPHMAPWWFPSNDHPADKATYDVSITTDAGMQVIGNGLQVSRTVSGSQATTHWRETRPMATYLAFFAAGHYAISTGTSPSGIPWLNAVSRDFTTTGVRHFRTLLGQSGAITDWLQKELGPYPFESTGGLVTTLDPGFALENQTRPTYAPWVDHTTVVHELAHQWFGDSVSLRRWQDVWMNEGFASYMEVRWREAHGGTSTRRWLRSAYAGAAPSFWRLPIGAPGVHHIWDIEVYRRGAMTLAALRARIGGPDFRRLLRSWAAQHRGGNGTTTEFEGLAHRISGQRLGGFFKAWLMTGEKPANTTANGLG